ncbi:MAG: hypothetical protein QXH26_00095 [Candidatus Hadarchaeales archaeon]
MGGRGGLGLRGIESLPAALLLSAILSVMVAGFGVRAMETLSEGRARQRAIQEFLEFTEAARAACSGEGRQVTLTEAEVAVSGRAVQLYFKGSPIRAEVLPVPFSREARLTPGSYTISLRRTGGGWFLEVE